MCDTLNNCPMPKAIAPLPRNARRRIRWLPCLALVWLLPLTATADHDSGRSAPIVGAGAHFAWVIFHELQPELERATGRKLELHGRNSALGMGCKAGIRNAGKHSPAHETFGFVCCPLDEAELAKNNLVLHPLAREPILILVNEANPVRNLSTAQVRAIFRGEIRNWKAVGGPDKGIVVVTRLHCRKRSGHWKHILPRAEDFRPDRLDVSGAEDMVQKINDFTWAIGHTGATWAFRADDRVRALTIDGHAPTAANLAAGRYPFHRQLGAVVRADARGDVLEVIRAVKQGKTFEKLARKYQLLPLNDARP